MFTVRRDPYTELEAQDDAGDSDNVPLSSVRSKGKRRAKPIAPSVSFVCVRRLNPYAYCAPCSPTNLTTSRRTHRPSPKGRSLSRLSPHHRYERRYNVHTIRTLMLVPVQTDRACGERLRWFALLREGWIITGGRIEDPPHSTSSDDTLETTFNRRFSCPTPWEEADHGDAYANHRNGGQCDKSPSSPTSPTGSCTDCCPSSSEA